MLEQLSSHSSPAICLFCRWLTISTFLNEHLLWFNFSEPYLTSPFPRIIMVQGGHRRNIPEPVKRIFVTMSSSNVLKSNSKNVPIRYIWLWCTPQTNTRLSCNRNRAALTFRNSLEKEDHHLRTVSNGCILRGTPLA